MTALAVVDPIARFAQLKSCPVCTRAVSPEEAACAHCGILVHKPRHEDFPPPVKWYALWEYARSTRFPSHVTDQEAWERLVCNVVNGSCTGHGRSFAFGLSQSAPIERCLPRVLPIAMAWREAGAPFNRDPFTIPTPA